MMYDNGPAVGVASAARGCFILFKSLFVVTLLAPGTNAFLPSSSVATTSSALRQPIVSFDPKILHSHQYHQRSRKLYSPLQQQLPVTSTAEESTKPVPEDEEVLYDYEIPEDAVIHIKPAAMRRLRELRDQRRREVSSSSSSDADDYLILRMGVRSGGCSGMSYVMDFCTKDSINPEEDQIDTYTHDKIQCVVDSKSMLYLYGLQLDYSTQLIGGGFKFYNPNAEESCGCGSSFGV